MEDLEKLEETEEMQNLDLNDFPQEEINANSFLIGIGASGKGFKAPVEQFGKDTQEDSSWQTLASASIYAFRRNRVAYLYFPEQSRTLQANTTYVNITTNLPEKYRPLRELNIPCGSFTDINDKILNYLPSLSIRTDGIIRIVSGSAFNFTCYANEKNLISYPV